jgi:hypothetical protein
MIILFAHVETCCSQLVAASCCVLLICDCLTPFLTCTVATQFAVFLQFVTYSFA